MQKHTARISVYLLPCILAFALFMTPARTETLHRVITETNVKIPMRDGVRLSANIFRPDSPGEFPALLMRTPYGKGGPKNAEGIYFAGQGYAVIVQDTRGRFDSEGIFDAMQPEAEDGYDTQEWIGSQPWCNSKIGTFGGSYVGFTQWMPAPLGSSYLKTMMPMVTFSNLYESLYEGGAFRLRLMSMWSIGVTAPYAFNAPGMIARLDSINLSLPLIEQDRMAGWRVSFLRDWIAHPEQDLYWKRTSVEDYSDITASVYNIGGWFDLLLGGTLRNFAAMTSKAIPPEVRSKQKLLIGPWVHGLSKDGKTGELDFGKESVMSGEMLRDLTRRWFDSELKSVNTGIWKEDPVKIFVMGENIWRTEKEWPLARTRYTPFYLHSDGNAATLNGSGSLDTETPNMEKADQFVYDPANPVPSALPGFFDPFTCGPRDQREIEKRQDVLVYSTKPLERKVEVTGPVRAVLYAASSAAGPGPGPRSSARRLPAPTGSVARGGARGQVDLTFIRTGPAGFGLSRVVQWGHIDTSYGGEPDST